ncbi:hypothetical protein PV721_43020 [Streptomyces sp. MB09-01]|uniref:hypothetical protein n=1 Tax=Streptomyces sp. MB09-01 TaxID=3028666 RepID=UPI0029B4BC5C|nr:hypothetical protein [Streptomyces sp. MB09-01]MDX3540940.1 hypothetical protein [Streptomyces sp. MB09-01]
MTAWQYFAGAGLVAALCPLHGHVAVAGDGHGRGARVDLCVPMKGPQPRGPVTRPSGRPSVRAAVPGADRPTVHHPGRMPAPAAALPGRPGLPERPARPERPAPGEPPVVPAPAEPSAEAGAGRAEPPEPAPDPAGAAAGAPADAPAPPGPRAAAASRVSAFHVRPYRAVALERRGPNGMSTVMLMVVVTTPAVLAAAALRPRSKSRG